MHPTDRRRRNGLPQRATAAATTEEQTQAPARPPSLDDLDVQVIGFLASDPRRSARAIARELGVAPSTVSQRVARLTRSSIITGYRTLLNAPALGYEVHAMLGLQTDQGPVLDEAIAALLTIREVENVHIVTGQWDMLVELRLRDHTHLLEVLRGAIYSIPGFRHVETMICLVTHSRALGWLPSEVLEEHVDPQR